MQDLPCKGQLMTFDFANSKPQCQFCRSLGAQTKDCIGKSPGGGPKCHFVCSAGIHVCAMQLHEELDTLNVYPHLHCMKKCTLIHRKTLRTHTFVVAEVKEVACWTAKELVWVLLQQFLWPVCPLLCNVLVCACICVLHSCKV